MFMKKYLLSSLKDYWDSVKRRDLLSAQSYGVIENETKGKDYRIHLRHGKSGILVMAPHGGGIEPGTTEIADAVAGAERSFYPPTQKATALPVDECGAG